MKTETLANQFTAARHSLLGPNWRYQTAQQPSPRASESDPWIRDLQGYFRLVSRGASDRAQQKYPLLAAALDLDGSSPTAKLKLMVLAGMAHQEMQQRTTISASVLEAWEAIHFDVRGFLRASSWLAAKVIEPERHGGDVALAARMKLAIAGGPVAVRAFLDSDETFPLDEAQRLYQRQLRLDLKVEQALMMPLDSERARLKLIDIYSDMKLREKRLKIQAEQLAQRCVEWRDRTELAKQRQELAMARAEALRQKRRKSQSAGPRRTTRQAHAEASLLSEHSDRAEQIAFQARIAASPLSALAWRTTARPVAPDAGQAAPAAASRPEQRLPVNLAAVKAACETSAFGWDREGAGPVDLQLAITA